jgi:hypothetical protein
MTQKMDLQDKEDTKMAANMEEEDDMEGMDGRAKALTNLLKTSSVSPALGVQTSARPLTRL